MPQSTHSHMCTSVHDFLHAIRVCVCACMICVYTRADIICVALTGFYNRYDDDRLFEFLLYPPQHSAGPTTPLLLYYYMRLCIFMYTYMFILYIEPHSGRRYAINIYVTTFIEFYKKKKKTYTSIQCTWNRSNFGDSNFNRPQPRLFKRYVLVFCCTAAVLRFPTSRESFAFIMCLFFVDQT